MDRVESPKVFIIILNWNGWEDTIECLESLYANSYPNYAVVIVDNDSQDDSLARIGAYARGEVAVESASLPYNCRNEPLHVTNYTRREAEDIPVITRSKKLAGKGRNKASNESLVIIQNEQNFGYPEGNNIGMRYALKASADYVLLLNNDTVVDKYFLTELVRAANEDASIGVIGPKIYSYEVPDVIHSTGTRINFWTGRTRSFNRGKRDDQIEYLTLDKLLPADYVSGACFLVKRKVIEEVGKLDPTYFLYGEEFDWCMRISRAGYRIVCDLDSKVWHKKTASTSKVRRFTEYYPHRNLVINMRKYARVSQFASFLLFYPAYWIAILIKARQIGNIRYFVRGFIDGLRAPMTFQPAVYDDKSA
jgi:GT2 family glycosyltransferase